MNDLYRRTKLWDGVGEPPGRESGAKLMWVVPATVDYEAAQHGMVLVPNGGLVVPTCLCGWVGAGEKNATAFGRARRSWQGHVELEGRLDIVDTVLGGNE